MIEHLRPRRIVSLLPSATEILCALGLEDRLVGVTHECDHPPMVRDLPKVTRTHVPLDAPSGEIDRLVRERLAAGHALYTLDRAVLEALEPDLIVTQTLCGVCAVAAAEVRAAAEGLASAPRVLELEPESLSAVLDSIRRVAVAAGVERQADEVVDALLARIDAVRTRSAGIGQRPRVVLLEWLDPPFSCGHWNPELARLAGGTEMLGREGQPSRMLHWHEVVAARPEVVLVACCGFDVARTLRDLAASREVDDWSDVPAARAGRVHVVDGSQYFSRPGPRLVDSLEILAHAIHPELHRLPPGLPALVAPYS